MNSTPSSFTFYAVMCGLHSALRQSTNIVSCLVCPACASKGTSWLRVHPAFSVFTFTYSDNAFISYHISFKSWAVSRGGDEMTVPGKNSDPPKEACLNFGQQCFKCLYCKRGPKNKLSKIEKRDILLFYIILLEEFNP